MKKTIGETTQDMQGVVLPHHEIRFVSFTLETLEIKQSFIQIGRRFPSFVICRRLEVNSLPIHYMCSYFRLELFARSVIQTRQQFVLVVGDQKQVFRPTLLQVVALGRHSSHHAACVAHERDLLTIETHFVCWNDNRLVRDGQLGFGNVKNRLVQIPCHSSATQRLPAGKRSISVIR